MNSFQALSTGIDLVDIQRFENAVERHGERLLNRVFTKREVHETECNIASLAARFAAKEAVAKALGVGIGVIGWKDIEILRDSAHKPILQLQGNAEKYAKELNLNHWSISLSHTHTYAIAMAAALSET